MASESKGNFIKIGPHERMNDDPIAIFYIDVVSEEGTTKYYPIVSNFYDTVSCFGSGTLMDFVRDPVPPQPLQGYMVNKIIYSGTVYWLSNVNDDRLIYHAIGDTSYITISTTDNWNTYTVTYTGGSDE